MLGEYRPACATARWTTWWLIHSAARWAASTM
jgi:hypothetical protein